MLLEDVDTINEIKHLHAPIWVQFTSYCDVEVCHFCGIPIGHLYPDACFGGGWWHNFIINNFQENLHIPLIVHNGPLMWCLRSQYFYDDILFTATVW